MGELFVPNGHQSGDALITFKINIGKGEEEP
jgi:hypothetical protein